MASPLVLVPVRSGGGGGSLLCPRTVPRTPVAGWEPPRERPVALADSRPDGRLPPCSRPGTYPYPETPLYTPAPGSSYYEAAGTPAQVSAPATSQAVASSGSVPMYVSGSPVVASATSSGAGASNGGGGGSGGGTGGGGGGGGGSSGGAAGTYVIQGGYMLGGASQSYSHTTRASPATVSAHQGRWGWGGGSSGVGAGAWSPGQTLGTLVPECSGKDGWPGRNPRCVTSGELLGLSGPQ